MYLSALGCRLNESELSTWKREFLQSGAQVASSASDADVVVVNTCAVTSEAVKKSRKLAAKLTKENPASQLVLTGCFAALEPEKAKAMTGAALIVANRDKDKLVQLSMEAFDATPAKAPQVSLPVLSRDELGHRTRAFIKVQDGCRNKCSFCIVTVARGEEKSRHLADIVEEVRLLESEGVKEVVLTGVHLGGYGHDLDTDLRTLVQKVLAHTTVARVRLSSLEPWDLPEGFWQLWDNPRLQPHLHLPLQSGSETVLRRMSRRCFTKDFRALVDGARTAIPNLNITTDLIVGFPGETEQEFKDSHDYVKSIGFGHVHTFPYSAREGTRAAKLPGALEKKVKKERSRIMRELAADMQKEWLQRQVGRTTDVLWEASSEKGGMVGYTDNYFRARLPIDGAVVRNQISKVSIDSATESELVVSLL